MTRALVNQPDVHSYHIFVMFLFIFSTGRLVSEPRMNSYTIYYIGGFDGKGANLTNMDRKEKENNRKFKE